LSEGWGSGREECIPRVCIRECDAGGIAVIKRSDIQGRVAGDSDGGGGREDVVQLAAVGASGDVLESDDLVDAVADVAGCVDSLGDEEIAVCGESVGVYGSGVAFCELLEEGWEEGLAATGCEVDGCWDCE